MNKCDANGDFAVLTKYDGQCIKQYIYITYWGKTKKILSLSRVVSDMV